MCEKHSYQWTSSAGDHKKSSQLKHCSKASLRGSTCEEPVIFKHPKGERPPSSSGSRYLTTNFPPSPPSSDASSFAHISSEDERSHKRRSSIYIDVNGKNITELSRKPSRRERRGSNHVVIVEPPASPRTPPRYESPPRASPRSPAYIHEARPSQHQSAYYVHPEVRLEVNRPRRDSAVQYEYVSPPSKSSNSSSSHSRRDSHSHGGSSTSSASDAAVREAKRKLREAKAEAAAAKQADLEAAERKAEESRRLRREEDARKSRKVQFEIDRQNESIANRPAAPQPPAPQQMYRRGSVSMKQTDAMLAESMQKVQIDADNKRRRRDRDLQRQREQAARDEELAQKERLRARLGSSSQRGDTVSRSHGSSSSRRPTVVYDEPYR